MLGKRVLNLIGLAFAARAFAGIVLPECSTVKGSKLDNTDLKASENAKSTITYCTDSDKIYEVTNISNFACKENVLDAGLYLFKVEANFCQLLGEEPSDWSSSCTNYFYKISTDCDTSVSIDSEKGETCSGNAAFNDPTHSKKITKVSLVDLTDSSADISSDTTKVVLYNCDDTQCQPTTGIVRDKAKNYSVAAEGEATDISGNPSYEVTTCNENTGKINTSSGNKLCISESSDVAGASGKVYVMKNVANNAFGTGSADNDKYIVIKTATNIFALDTFVTGATVAFCANDVSLIVAEKNNYCEPGTIEYSGCTNGVCSKGITLPTCASLKNSFVPETHCTAAAATTVISHCIHDGNGKIYPVTNVETFNCINAPLEAGLHVFNVPATTTCIRISDATFEGWSTACTSYYSDNQCTTHLTSCTGENDYVQSQYYKKDLAIEVTDLGNAILSSILGRLVLYNCGDSKCVPTSGFVTDKATNYIISSIGVATDATSYEVTSDCNDGSVAQTGKINKAGSDSETNKLCIDATSMAKHGGVYIMKNVASNAFSTGDPDKYIVIKADTNAYGWDNLIDNGVQFVKTVGGKVITDIDAETDLRANADAPQAYTIYNCDKCLCQQTYGYIKSDTQVFAYVQGKNAVKVESTIESESKCKLENVGQVVADGGICINENKKFTFATDERIFLPLAPPVKGTPLHNGKEGVPVKVGANYIVWDNYYNGVNMVKKDDGQYINDFSNQITISNGYVLVDCIDGVCRQTQGYIIGSHDDAYAFVGEGVGEDALQSNKPYKFGDASYSECHAKEEEKKNIGKILGFRGGICFYTTDGYTFNSINEVRMVLQGTAIPKTPFYDEDYYVPLKRGSHYIIRNKFYNGVNLVKTDDGSVVTDFSGTIIVANGYVLIDCVDGTCRQTQGYIKDSAKVVAFVGDGLEAIGVPTAGEAKYEGPDSVSTNDCNSNSGKLYGSSKTDGICIAEGNTKLAFQATGDTVTKYIVTSGVSTTPFGDVVAIKQGTSYFIIDKFNSNVSLVIESTQVMRDGFTGIANTDIVFDCFEGKCKQTAGYIVNGNAIYGFIGTSNGADITSNTNLIATGVKKMSGCNKDNTGKFFVNGSSKFEVCIDVGRSVDFENESHYVVGKGVTGTALGDSNPSVEIIAIKSGEGYVVKDVMNSSATLVKKEDGSSTSDLITANAKLAANPGEYAVYDCESAVCRCTFGYIINNKKVFSFTGTNGGIEVVNGGVSSCSGSAGKLNTNANGICVSSSTDVPLTSTDKHFIVKAVSGTPFTSSTESIPIKCNPNYVIKDTFYATQFNLVKKDDGTIKSDLSSAIADLDNNYLIVECVNKVCIQTPGYLENGGEVYMFVGSEAGSKVAAGSKVDATGCANNGGKVVGIVSICYGSEANKVIAFGTTNAVILKGKALNGTPFYDNLKHVPVKGTANYIIKDNFYDGGVILVNNADGSIIDSTTIGTGVDLNENNYILLDCKDGGCKQTKGFILDYEKLTRKRTSTDNVFVFDGENTGVKVTDEAAYVGSPTITATAGVSGCDEAYIGKLYGTTGVCALYHETATSRVGISFLGVNAGNYIIKGGHSTSLFAGNVAVKMGKRYIVKDVYYNTGDYCAYADTTSMAAKKTRFCKGDVIADTEFYKCTDGDCEVKTDLKDNVENGIYMMSNADVYQCKKGECKKYDGDDIFVFKNLDTEDDSYYTMLNDTVLNSSVSSSDMKLYHCFEEKCEATEGFIRYSSGTSLVAVGTGTSLSISSFVECSSVSDVGKVRVNMDLCVAEGSTKPILKDGVFSSTNIYYKRTGINVVGQVKRTGNYYSDGVLKSCSSGGGTCSPGNTGYTYNSNQATNKEYPVIYCSGAGTGCEKKARTELANGFYLNNDANSDVVICSNEKCELKTNAEVTKINCSSNKYELIYIGGGTNAFKFCKGSSEEALPTGTGYKYYLLKDRFIPDRKFDYPINNPDPEAPYPRSFLDSTGVIPERNILIRTDIYSVTVLTGDNIPIGYLRNDDNSGFIECDFKDGRRKCKEATIVDGTVAGTKTCQNIGELFKINDGAVKYKVCLDATEEKEVEIDLAVPDKKYVIQLGNGKFGVDQRSDSDNYYLVLGIDALGNATIEKEDKSTRYIYTDTDTENSRTKYEIIEKTTALSTVSTVGGICHKDNEKPYEFELKAWTISSGGNPEVDYYVDNNSSSS